MSNPHDALFRAAFSDPDHARGALRAICPASPGSVMRYILMVNRMDREQLGVYVGRVCGPQGQEVVMTEGQRLIEEGRVEGRVQGRAEGQIIGERALLLRLLRNRFGPVPLRVEALVNDARSEQVERWCQRIMQAGSLDDVFAV